jgi:hypothetical protein
MSSTMQERELMMEKSSQAGYSLTYTMYIMEEMIDFIKSTKGKPVEEQLETLKKDRWLGTTYFLPNARKWLEVCSNEEVCND